MRNNDSKRKPHTAVRDNEKDLAGTQTGSPTRSSCRSHQPRLPTAIGWPEICHVKSEAALSSGRTRPRGMVHVRDGGAVLKEGRDGHEPDSSEALSWGALTCCTFQATGLLMYCWMDCTRASWPTLFATATGDSLSCIAGDNALVWGCGRGTKHCRCRADPVPGCVGDW